jgi:hypothetical protein
VAKLGQDSFCCLSFVIYCWKLFISLFIFSAPYTQGDMVIINGLFNLFCVKNHKMKEQNFDNHTRIAPKSYYTGILLGLVILIASLFCNKCISACMQGLMLPLLFSFTGISLILSGWYARMFALKAQDRAIRAEENLRHFALTGKLLDSKLTISQIVALRFAGDEEFVSLAARAAAENLSNKQIKQAIKNWRADYYRV